MEAIIFSCILMFVVIFIFLIGHIKDQINEDSTNTETMSESSQSS